MPTNKYIRQILLNYSFLKFKPPMISNTPQVWEHNRVFVLNYDTMTTHSIAGMSRSPPDSSAFLNPNNRAKPPQPPIAAENNHRPDDNTSIVSVEVR